MVVLTDSFWRRKFSADPSILGRKIVVNGAPHEVIAVTDPAMLHFRGRRLDPDLDWPEHVDVFLPLHFTPREEKGEPSNAYLAIGRLKPGVAPEQARAEAQVTNPTFLYEDDERINYLVSVNPLQSVLAVPHASRCSYSSPLSLLFCSLSALTLRTSSSSAPPAASASSPFEPPWAPAGRG